MPIRSKKQWKFLFARHPRIAHRFAHEKGQRSYRSLPTRVRKRRRR